jgi:VWFA-related protein
MAMRHLLAIASIVAVSAALGAVAPAQRQSPPGRSAPPPASPPRQGTPPPVFRAGADLVTVDVVVVDKAGKAVRGLKADAFTVLDRKTPQTVAAFQEVSHVYAETARAAALPVSVMRDVADNRTAQSQRLVVVVVDDLHIFSGRTDRAKELTKQIISRLGPDASMALLFTSGEHSTQVTEDRALLLAAADTLKGRQSVRRPHSANETNFAKGFDPEMSAEAKAEILKTVGSGQDFFENMDQYKTLEDAARLVGSGDDIRRKAFVLISEGISKDLTGLFTSGSSMSKPPGDAGAPPSPSADNAVASDYHNAALRRAMESLRRSNVSAYAIDPRGRVAPQDLARESFPSPAGLLWSTNGKPTDDDSAVRTTNPIRLAQTGLSILSEASGGFAVTDSDDFTGGLGRVIDDLDHYYLIGFRPIDTGGNGYRPIDVRVTGHPEWTLRFRRGYLPGAPPALPARADPLISGVMPKTDLPLRLFALPFPGTTAAGIAPGGRVRTSHVALALEISAPTRAMLEPDGRLHDDVSYQVLVIDEQKAKAVSQVRHAARLALKPITGQGPMPDVVAYQIDLSIDLVPGRYQLRASASSTKLGKGGSVYLSLDVPDFSAVPIALSGLAIGYADGARLPIAPADPAAGVPAHPLPFGPSLDRQFASTDGLKIYFEVARLNAADAATVTVAVADQSDRSVMSADHPLAPNASGRMLLTQSLASLQPGAYRLRVTATSGPNAATREVGFVVRGSR